MIKAKEVSLILLFFIVLSAGYFIARPRPVSMIAAPVFMSEEIVVHKGATVVTAVKAQPAVAVQTAPAPISAAPLPIIPPAVNYKVLPAYPTGALEKDLAGTVILSVYVGLNGQPEKIETRRSSGVAVLDEAASAAVSQWRFSPATQSGQALASWFEVPVRFAIK